MINENLVFVKDASNLILQMINKRSLNPYCTVAGISIDGGQGFLKCIVNVFNPLYNFRRS